MKQSALAATFAIFAIQVMVTQEGGADPVTPILIVCIAPVMPPQYEARDLPPDPSPPKCLDQEKYANTCQDRVVTDWNTQVKARAATKRARVDEIEDYNQAVQIYQRDFADYARSELARVSKLRQRP